MHFTHAFITLYGALATRKNTQNNGGKIFQALAFIDHKNDVAIK